METQYHTLTTTKTQQNVYNPNPNRGKTVFQKSLPSKILKGSAGNKEGRDLYAVAPFSHFTPHYIRFSPLLWRKPNFPANTHREMSDSPDFLAFFFH